VAATYPVSWGSTPLAAGARRSLVYDVPLPGGWFRDFGIGVQVRGADGRPVTARTVPASVRPWGEPLACAVLLLGVVLIVLGRRGGHRAAAPGSEAPDEPAPGEIPETVAANEPAARDPGSDLC